MNWQEIFAIFGCCALAAYAGWWSGFDSGYRHGLKVALLKNNDLISGNPTIEPGRDLDAIVEAKRVTVVHHSPWTTESK